jgi:hypothetical protein
MYGEFENLKGYYYYYCCFFLINSLPPADRLRDWLFCLKRLFLIGRGLLNVGQYWENFYVKNFEKLLRTKREGVDWCFANFQKTLKSFDREAFWFKVRKNRVGERMFRSIQYK